MGLRPTHGNENATVRHRRINGLWRAFNRAVYLRIITSAHPPPESHSRADRVSETARYQG
jgi:hypothetical protein